MNKLYNDFPWIQEDLIKINNRMKQITKTNENDFNEAVYELYDAKSKMLRPLFLLTAARMYGINSESYTMGAAIEMLHVASLVHDDIIDEAKTRRGIESIQSHHGKGFAVMAGDYLFTRALSTIAKSKRVKDINKTLEAIVEMTAGEITQHYEKFRNDCSLDNYYRVIDAKTASLFSLSLFLGGTVSYAPDKVVEKLSEIGKLFGRAFQIYDDLKDYEQDEVSVGKPTMHDLNRGIYTLPAILTLQEDAELKVFLNNDGLPLNFNDLLLEKVKNNDSLKQSRQIADSYINQALEIIQTLKKCHERELLTKLVTLYN